MLEQLKKSGTKLAIGLIIFFTLVGIYMYSMRMGFLYRTVDGYLIILPIARLGLMLVIVGLLLGLTRTLGETMINGFGVAFKRKAWSSGDSGPRIYKDLLWYPLLLLGLLFGYFMLRGNVSKVISPLRKLDWVPLVFGIAWIALCVFVIALYTRKIGTSREELRAWFAERKRARAAILKTESGAAALWAQGPSTAEPTVEGQAPVQRAEAPILCPKCGAGLKPDIRFCTRCGAAVL